MVIICSMMTWLALKGIISLDAPMTARENIFLTIEWERLGSKHAWFRRKIKRKNMFMLPLIVKWRNYMKKERSTSRNKMYRKTASRVKSVKRFLEWSSLEIIFLEWNLRISEHNSWECLEWNFLPSRTMNLVWHDEAFFFIVKRKDGPH